MTPCDLPVLIARENTPALLQLIGSEIEELLHAHPPEDGGYSVVVQDLYSARRQLWVIPYKERPGVRLWVITKIVSDEHGVRRLILDLMKGESFDELLPGLEYIETWALQLGATEVRAAVRPGLRKKLKSVGYAHRCDMVVKSLQGKLH